MPEGPSIILVKEALAKFVGRKVLSASGSSSLEYDRINGRKIKELRSWGKHFLIVFDDFAIRVHFLMFGTYRVDEKRELKPRLSLSFASNHEVNFYTCAVRWIEGDIDDAYDWTTDVMGSAWTSSRTKKRLKDHADQMVCDVLMDQNLFSGVGNIIKNEVLFRVSIHPETIVADLPATKLSALIREARNYSFEFLAWRREGVLKKNWKIYSKKICPRCNIPVVKRLTGKSERRTFFCTNCQIFYPS